MQITPSLSTESQGQMREGCCVNRSSLNGSEPVGYLVLIQISLLLLRKAVILKLKEVCIKERSHSALCEFIGRVTGHTTLKWPIRSKAIEGLSALQFVKIQLACMYIHVPGVFHLQKILENPFWEFAFGKLRSICHKFHSWEPSETWPLDREKYGTDDKNNKDEKSVNGHKFSIGKFPPGKRDYRFRNPVYCGKLNSVEWIKKSCSIYIPTGISGFFWWIEKAHSIN